MRLFLFLLPVSKSFSLSPTSRYSQRRRAGVADLKRLANEMKKCPKCGEESEDQFDSCWNCQTFFNDNCREDQRAEIAEDLASSSPPSSRSGYFWLASILVPLGLFFLGYVSSISRGGYEGLAAIFICLVLAAVSSIGFAFVSIVRQEKAAIIALAVALVGFGFLVFLGMSIAKR